MTKGIKVPKADGEVARRRLAEMDLLHPRLRISSDGVSIYMPVLDQSEALRAVGGMPIEMEFRPDLRRLTPEDLLGRRPSFEVIGEIAIVEDDRPEEVASVLLSLYKNISTVISPISEVVGEYRTRKFEHVAGEVLTKTVFKEHGLSYHVDLERAYFTQRLGTERLRVAQQVSPGEAVLDMFAGVGPFSLLCAKMGARVVAIEKNPVAAKLLRENIRQNRLLEVEVLEGDCREHLSGRRDCADRTIMNLPHSASDFLGEALAASRSGGVVHFYAFTSVDDLFAPESAIQEAAEERGWMAEILYRGVVRSYAPRRFNVVLDFRVLKG